MYALHIDAGGSWSNLGICGNDNLYCGGTWGYGPYNCVGPFIVPSINDKYGCSNPSGMGRVYVNCRAEMPN